MHVLKQPSQFVSFDILGSNSVKVKHYEKYLTMIHNGARGKTKLTK